MCEKIEMIMGLMCHFVVTIKKHIKSSQKDSERTAFEVVGRGDRFESLRDENLQNDR